MSKRIKKTPTLMLVEDPRDTINAMCDLKKRIFNRKEFKKTYEKIKNRIDNPVSKGTFDTHFYSLTQFGLIKEISDDKYELSEIGRSLCNLIKDDLIDKYEEYLKRLLLNNEEKGYLFESFLNYLSDKKFVKKNELYKVFKEFTARALISWSLEVKLIEFDKDNDTIWKIKKEPIKDITIYDFWNEIIKEYKKLIKTDLFLIDPIFVDISQLRLNFCLNHANFTLNKFDKSLRKLMSTKYKQQIRLYGGPSSTFEGKRNFLYDGRVYAYIRLKV